VNGKRYIVYENSEESKADAEMRALILAPFKKSFMAVTTRWLVTVLPQ